MKAPKQLPVPLLIGMEDSAKNNADALFFTQLFVPQAPQIVLMAEPNLTFGSPTSDAKASAE